MSLTACWKSDVEGRISALEEGRNRKLKNA